jgi:hypothetical protein
VSINWNRLRRTGLISDWIEGDEVLVETGPKVGDYFDGNDYACKWTGTANNSTSISNRQAQDVADTFLGVHQLEQFNLSLNAVNFFYLDAGNIVAFEDPNLHRVTRRSSFFSR